MLSFKPKMLLFYGSLRITNKLLIISSLNHCFVGLYDSFFFFNVLEIRAFTKILGSKAKVRNSLRTCLKQLIKQFLFMTLKIQYKYNC